MPHVVTRRRSDEPQAEARLTECRGATHETLLGVKVQNAIMNEVLLCKKKNKCKN
ncbi:hypothetical protein YC2023_105770 [Brassica napus]